MDNISYHGTSKLNAKSITGPPMNVQVEKGRGELGKGFYTGSSIALAAIWAQARHRDNAVVIEFEIPKEKFITLNGHLIKTRSNVISKWRNLIVHGTTDSHTHNVDYVIAPFATIEHTGHQLKFESKKAENVLNTSKVIVLPCV